MAELRTTPASGQLHFVALGHLPRAVAGFAIAIAGATAALLSALSANVSPTSWLVVISLVPAAFIDIRTHRIPNAHVLAAIAIGVAHATASSLFGATIDVRAAATGLAVMATPVLVMHLVSPAAMGFGDVKAAAVLGCAMGLTSAWGALLALMLACAATAASGIAMRRRTIAFGPGLVVGTFVALAIFATIGDPLDRTVRTDSAIILEGHR